MPFLFLFQAQCQGRGGGDQEDVLQRKAKFRKMARYPERDPVPEPAEPPQLHPVPWLLPQGADCLVGDGILPWLRFGHHRGAQVSTEGGGDIGHLCRCVLSQAII